MKRRFIAFALALLFVGADLCLPRAESRGVRPLTAGANASAPAPQEPTLRVDVELTLVEATVKDKSGKIISDLTKDDFVVLEDGVAQNLTHFSRDQIPLAVALVVDRSTSIEPFLNPLRYATMSALRALKPEDEVALFFFTHIVQRPVALTKNKRAVSDQFENLDVGGATNINDAVYEAARYLAAAAPAARRVIILVSDNKATSATIDSGEVTEQALRADAAVYGIKVPGENRVGLTGGISFRGGLVNVGKLAEATGAEVFDVEKEGSLYLTFKTVIERLKTRYTLGYYPANSASDGKFRQIEVRLAEARGKKDRDYKLLAKRGYYSRNSNSRNSTR